MTVDLEAQHAPRLGMQFCGAASPEGIEHRAAGGPPLEQKQGSSVESLP